VVEGGELRTLRERLGDEPWNAGPPIAYGGEHVLFGFDRRLLLEPEVGDEAGARPTVTSGQRAALACTA
jgi:hypothetical protein